MFKQNVGFCVAAGENLNDPFADLDPDMKCPPENKVHAGSLKPCKPNCRGGKEETSTTKFLWVAQIWTVIDH